MFNSLDRVSRRVIDDHYASIMKKLNEAEATKRDVLTGIDHHVKEVVRWEDAVATWNQNGTVEDSVAQAGGNKDNEE
ncbi:hypothetical protein EKO27_g10648 [Xylaria grammica]|uniref:Uncharacterized protein n=1 Tax=Xylaria grammica TaxID=363999 RepID=A0A439CQL6_9PEZI|nr:hypothetical protein EKO27_g10648 [Xylaria grammica]